MDKIWASYRELSENRFMFMFKKLSKSDIYASGGRLSVMANKKPTDIGGYGVEGRAMSELLLPGMSKDTAASISKFDVRQSNTLLNLT